PRYQLLLPEQEQDAAVADVLALRRELAQVARAAVHGLLATQARGGVGVGPRGHLGEQAHVAVRQIRADEALLPHGRGDLPHALQVGQVQPLLRRPAGACEREEAGPLHLGRSHHEGDRLTLAVRASLVHLDLVFARTASAVDDANGRLLAEVLPPTGGLLAVLAPV